MHERKNLRAISIYQVIVLLLIMGSLTHRDLALAGTTGSAGGRTLFVTAQVVENVRITLRGSGMPGTRQAVSDKLGRFHFLLVPPGIYTVTANASYYKTWVRHDVIVRINEKTDPDIVLEEKGYICECVSVITSFPIRDAGSSWIGLNLNRTFTERLPGSDNLEDIATISSQVIAPDAVNPQINHDPAIPVSGLHISGGTAYDNQFISDGVDVTNPLYRTLGIHLNADAIEEIQIMTGGLPAEYGGAMGGIVTAISRVGGERFSGILRSSWDLDVLTASTQNSEERGEFHSYDRWRPTVSLGGPLLAERLWFFVSAGRSRTSDSRAVVRANDWSPGYETEFVRSYDKEYSWLGNLTWSATPEHRLHVTWSDDRRITTNASPMQCSADAQADLTLAGQRLGLSWDYLITSMIVLETRLGFFAAHQDWSPQDDADRYPVYDRQRNTWFARYPYEDRSSQSRTSFSSTATIIRDTSRGSHEIKAGIDVQHLIREHDFSFTNGRH